MIETSVSRAGIILLLCLPGSLAASRISSNAAAERLKLDLLSSSSATQVLTERCIRLKLANPPRVQAIQQDGFERQPNSAVRKALGVLGEPIRYRRVKLVCGGRVLSDADNWYVPDRLTPAMNRTLETTTIPFGAVVKPLKFHRKTLNVSFGHGFGTVLRVTALLVTSSGKPFSLVVENYSAVLTAQGSESRR